MWRFAGGVHRVLEQLVVRRARSVTVFNEQYASVVRRWNPKARFSPTWYDPALLRRDGAGRDPFRILWVGRLERPKDPMLAVAAFQRLTESDPGSPWTLELLGGGTLLGDLRKHVEGLPEPLRTRVFVRGRVEPDGVAERMAAAGVFLMTSHPGYEGYPRVLVEALASGLPAAVTDGSDTGGLIEAGRTGLVSSRDPGELAAAIAAVSTLDRAVAMERVAPFDAPHLVAEIFRQASMPRTKESA
jgi:glycosyltransferase involved in cell wall biosynthesis